MGLLLFSLLGLLGLFYVSVAYRLIDARPVFDSRLKRVVWRVGSVFWPALLVVAAWRTYQKKRRVA